MDEELSNALVRTVDTKDFFHNKSIIKVPPNDAWIYLFSLIDLFSDPFIHFAF